MRLFHVTFEGDSLTVNFAINNPTITQDWVFRQSYRILF